MKRLDNVIWQPQSKQMLFMARAEDEALYGGAAGGGKSDAMVMEATRQVHISHYKGLILRKTFPQLEELIDKSLYYYPKAFPGARYNTSAHSWRFPSGAKINFGSMQHTKDRLNYQGKAYDFIGYDEATQFTYDEYMYLLSRNRPNGPGTRCYMRATANPGGIGHDWVRARFIDAAAPMETIWERAFVHKPDGSTWSKWMSRIFCPSSVFDNQILLDNDPNYLARLASMPEAERKALLYGDWDSFQGQFFGEFRNNPEGYITRQYTHVIEPFEIPPSWPIYRSFDWGYNRPFSVGWWTVDFDGTVYRILEFYGGNGQPNQGKRWHPQKVFEEIRRIEHEQRWLKDKSIIGIADPAIWDGQLGESVAETAEKYGIYFSPGDHARLPGWMQVHYRLDFDEHGYAMMYVFKNCRDFIRTVPALVYSDTKPEDLNTEGEDHIADEMRYFLMSRPIKPKRPYKPENRYRHPYHLYLDVDPKDIKATDARGLETRDNA